MSDDDSVLLDDRGASAIIALNRPAALNSISPAMVDGLNRALDRLQGRSSFAALAITGRGRAFCAGADIRQIGEWLEAPGNAAKYRAFLVELMRLFVRIEQFPAPVIAAVNGVTAAGGLELVLCCDLVVATESASFGDAHANYGLVPGGGASARLPRKIGHTRARQLMFTGGFVPARTGEQWGLVSQVVPDGELEPALDRLLAELARHSPIGLRYMKQLVADCSEQPLATALRHEIAVNMQHLSTRDRTEGIRAFMEKRKPRFSGD